MTRPGRSRHTPPGYQENICPVGDQRSLLQVVGEKCFDIAPSTLVKPGCGGIHFFMSKLKITLTGFMFLLVLLFGLSRVDSRNPDTKNNHNGYAESGTFKR